MLKLLRISIEMATFSVLFPIEKAAISIEIRSKYCIIVWQDTSRDQQHVRDNPYRIQNAGRDFR